MKLARRQDKPDRIPPPPPVEPADLFRDYSVNVQRALHEWTAKVDTKASVVLTLETAVFGAVLAFSTATKPLTHLDGSAIWFYRAGISLLVGAILCAGAAVFPQLNRRDARRSWKRNYVYFGHLRWWRPTDLITAVQKDGTERGNVVTSTQIIALSKIVWRKHVFLQWSMSLALLGGICVGTAAMLH
jgi:hypothetical protein